MSWIIHHTYEIQFLNHIIQLTVSHFPPRAPEQEPRSQTCPRSVPSVRRVSVSSAAAVEISPWTDDRPLRWSDAATLPSPTEEFIIYSMEHHVTYNIIHHTNISPCIPTNRFLILTKKAMSIIWPFSYQLISLCNAHFHWFKWALPGNAIITFTLPGRAHLAASL